MEPDFSGLQTVFLTDERLDLPTIIDKISALPGLQTALLHTADGRRLAGAIGDEQFERTVLTLFPILFGEVKTKLDEQACTGLETLTFCWRQEQISVFSDGRLCLSVRHSRRPFKPGVREKLSLILSRLASAKRERISDSFSRTPGLNGRRLCRTDKQSHPSEKTLICSWRQQKVSVSSPGHARSSNFVLTSPKRAGNRVRTVRSN